MLTVTYIFLTEISNTFDLVFLSGSLMDYVSMPVSEDLSTVTISLWMQTNDFTNQGTIFSYIVSGSLVFSLMDYSGLEVRYSFPMFEEASDWLNAVS